MNKPVYSKILNIVTETNKNMIVEKLRRDIVVMGAIVEGVKTFKIVGGEIKGLEYYINCYTKDKKLTHTYRDLNDNNRKYMLKSMASSIAAKLNGLDDIPIYSSGITYLLTVVCGDKANEIALIQLLMEDDKIINMWLTSNMSSHDSEWNKYWAKCITCLANIAEVTSKRM